MGGWKERQSRELGERGGGSHSWAAMVVRREGGREGGCDGVQTDLACAEATAEILE